MAHMASAIEAAGPATTGTWDHPLHHLTARIGRHLHNLGLLRSIVRIAMVAFVTLAASGIGHAIMRSAGPETGELAEMVKSVTDPEMQARPATTDFTSSIGYVPVRVEGSLTDPDGGCSVPGGIGPELFEAACQTHDLGYDILRAADAKGEPLGPWARFDLDLHFYGEMLETCDSATCRATATAYYGMVTANSIRQGYNAPGIEPGAPWLALAGLVLVLPLVPPGRARR